MKLEETIRKRRSIRSFKDTNVPKEIIEDIINCARLAPSAKNRQPWKFIVVNKEIKDKIADIMLNKNYNEENSAKYSAKVIKQAPILILVFNSKEEIWEIGDNLSIGAAIEHICLRATDLGLGSLWIRDTTYTDEEISKLIGNEDIKLICAISIGYPNEEPKQRPRKKLEEIMEWK